MIAEANDVSRGSSTLSASQQIGLVQRFYVFHTIVLRRESGLSSPIRPPGKGL